MFRSEDLVESEQARLLDSPVRRGVAEGCCCCQGSPEGRKARARRGRKETGRARRCDGRKETG